VGGVGWGVGGRGGGGRILNADNGVCVRVYVCVCVCLGADVLRFCEEKKKAICAYPHGYVVIKRT